MEFDFLSNLLAAGAFDDQAVMSWLQYAFYPALLGILVIASLGLPIPEDIPLIAAGFILKTHPGTASWPGTFLVALIGIMSGDLVLYTFGRRVGPAFIRLKFTRWFVTPSRYERTMKYFHRWGVWAVFFGRFIVGVRAMMCMTAGATRFPYWKFFLADCLGALLSIPLFVGLGYVCANMLPTLRDYIAGANIVILFLLTVGIIVGVIYWRRRRRRREAGDVVLKSAAKNTSNAA